MISHEEWRDIAGYEGLYQVSSNGSVRSIKRKVQYSDGRIYHYPEKVLTPTLNKSTGYLYVYLYKSNNKPRNARVNVLVTEAFYGARQSGLESCHRDGDKINNKADNLYWGTREENNADKFKHGTQPIGSRVFGAKLKESEVKHIRRLLNNHSNADLGRMYGVSGNLIRDIRTGRTWKHLD